MATLAPKRPTGARVETLSRYRTTRVAVALAWPIALIAWLYDQTAHLGFNVLDEGLMAAYAHRILEGQVPHRDFISPRPVVSSLIHLPDLIAPMPLYLAARLDGITEVVLFSIAISWLVFRRPPWEWGLIRTCATAAAALINLHTFGETAWYTFDGLLLVTAAFLLVDSGLRAPSHARVVTGLLVAGLAATTKQSFVPASLAMLAWLAWSWRADELRPRLRRLAGSAGLLALPGALYLAVISAFGGLPDAISQMHTGRLVWGRSLFEMVGLIHHEVFGRPLFHGHFPWEVLLAAIALLVARQLRLAWPIRGLLAVAVTALMFRLALRHHLEWAGSWSLEVMWALILVTVARVPFERRVDWRAVAVLFLGWMSMLSWGYELPALVAGSMCLVVGTWAFTDVPITELRVAPRRVLVSGGALAAIALFVFTAAKEVSAREAQPYFDRSAKFLTASVGDVDHDFSGISTAPATSEYMHGLKSCLRRYPARWVAVIPDNPGIYAAMNLHNPFPIDWFWKNDYQGQQQRLIDAASALEREGDYLVLFQTVSGLFLFTYDHLPQATHHSSPVFLRETILYDPALGESIIRELPSARHVICGSFLGLYEPISRPPASA